MSQFNTQREFFSPAKQKMYDSNEQIIQAYQV